MVPFCLLCATNDELFVFRGGGPPVFSGVEPRIFWERSCELDRGCSPTTPGCRMAALNSIIGGPWAGKEVKIFSPRSWGPLC